MRKINDAGIDLIREFEGLRLEAYRCPAGVLTIGYGHTRTARPGQRIRLDQALDLLRQDLQTFEEGVEAALSGAPTTDNQFAAMVSLAFNIGVKNFRGSSVLRFHVQGLHDPAANAFGRWIRAGGKVLAGLVRRRKAEAALYRTPDA
jgi:lysozyme